MTLHRETIQQGERNYEAMVDGKMSIIIGPPEGMVDEMGFPEPFATRLHNILHSVGLLNFGDVMHNPRTLQGALQEALQVDVQRLTEFFMKYGQEAHNG